MRLSFLTLAAIVSSASAMTLFTRQDMEAINNCILTCAGSETVSMDGCAFNDNACLCRSYVFVNGMTACFHVQCPDIAATVISAATRTCERAGVTAPPTAHFAPEPTATA